MHQLRLKNNTSPGPEGVVNEVLKMLPSEIQRVMHMLFIIMWATGVTPQAWKIAKLCSLIKIKEKRHK